MKTLRSALVIFFGISVLSTAFAAQLAALLGTPDFSLPFVRGIVQSSVPVHGYPTEIELTTRVYSVLARTGVTSAYSIEVLFSNGSTTFDVLHRGFSNATLYAPVVYTPVGGAPEDNDSICRFVAMFPDTAFVLSAGGSSFGIGHGDEPGCLAPNILRVATLNQDQSDLDSRSGFGSTIRLAAPGIRIYTVGAGGVPSETSGATLSSAFAASYLAQFGELHPELKGGALIERFLTERTVVLPALEGKVAGAKALLLPGERRP